MHDATAGASGGVIVLRRWRPSWPPSCASRPDAPARAPRARRPFADGTFPATCTSTRTDRTAGARRRRSPPPPRAPASSSSSSPITATHADTRTAGVPVGRAVPRRRRDQHHRRPLHRARHAGRAVSAGWRAARRRRGRAAAGRVRRSPRIPTRPSPGCAGATGRAASTASNGSTPTRAGACAPPRDGGGVSRLAAGLLHYPIRPAETLASLLTGLRRRSWRWNALAARPPRRRSGRRRRACQARAAQHRIRSTTGSRSRCPATRPRSGRCSVHVAPDRPLSGDAAADAALLMRAIRAGHLYSPSTVSRRRPRSNSRPPTPGHGRRRRRARRRRARVAPRAQQRAARLHDDRSGGTARCWRARRGTRFTVPRWDRRRRVYRVEMRTGERPWPADMAARQPDLRRAPAAPPGRAARTSR